MANNPLILLPSYNERENIRKLVTELLSAAPAGKICVIDDNSPDGTAQEVRALQQSLPEPERERVHLIVRGKKDGRGGAVREGMLWGLMAGRFDSFIEMDCDLSHPPSDIPRGLALLGDADVVIGARYPNGKIIGWPWNRKLLSFIANTLARALISREIGDYTNGFRFYSARAAKTLSEQAQKHRGYIYLSEALACLLKKGYRVASFPTVFVNRQRGASNTGLQEITSAFLGLFQIAWNFRFGR